MKEQIIKLYSNDNLSINAITKIVKMAPFTIKKILIENGIKLRNIITEFDEIQIIEYYKSGKTIKDISKLLHFSERKISKLLKDNNIYTNNKKHRCDSNFFNCINTEEKAYWLGFLYADGNVATKTNTVLISSKDREHIEKFLLTIKSTDVPHREFHKKYNKEI